MAFAMWFRVEPIENVLVSEQQTAAMDQSQRWGNGNEDSGMFASIRRAGLHGVSASFWIELFKVLNPGQVAWSHRLLC